MSDLQAINQLIDGLISYHLASIWTKRRWGGGGHGSNSKDLKWRGRDACSPGEWCRKSHHQLLHAHQALDPLPSPTDPSQRPWEGSGVERCRLPTMAFWAPFPRREAPFWGGAAPRGPSGSQEGCPPRRLQIRPGLIISSCTTLLRPRGGSPQPVLSPEAPELCVLPQPLPALLPTAPRASYQIEKAKVLSWPRRPSLTGPPLTPPPTLFPSALLTNSCPLSTLALRRPQGRDAGGPCLGVLFSSSPLG